MSVVQLELLAQRVAEPDDADKPKDGDDDKGKGGDPVEYTDFNLPVGMEMDKEALDAFVPLAQKHNLSQVEAQEMVDLQANAVTRFSKAQTDAWADRQAGWVRSAEEDKEYGGKNYDASVMIAKSAMRQVGGSDLVAALNETGMGNHPELIRFFYLVGVAIGEDNLDFGGVNTGGGKTLAERMFPNQGK